MRKYSDYFKTLHDENGPTGRFGRGTHYSALRAVVFTDSVGNPLDEARFADFAIIWDEDHDDRVIEAVERIYFAGLLPSFVIFGERKGGFTAIPANDLPGLPAIQARLNKITQQLDNGDSWPAQIVGLGKPDHPIINASDDKVSLYLKTLMMLWELGSKPAKRDSLNPE